MTPLSFCAAVPGPSASAPIWLLWLQLGLLPTFAMSEYATWPALSFRSLVNVALSPHTFFFGGGAHRKTFVPLIGACPTQGGSPPPPPPPPPAPHAHAPGAAGPWRERLDFRALPMLANPKVGVALGPCLDPDAPIQRLLQAPWPNLARALNQSMYFSTKTPCKRVKCWYIHYLRGLFGLLLLIFLPQQLEAGR